jgi:hypothetical protein
MLNTVFSPSSAKPAQWKALHHRVWYRSTRTF